ncbi:MAG: hypothetical protein WC855_12225 [Thermodesulfovibrionales bacterium]
MRKDFRRLWRSCENNKIREGGLKMQAIDTKRMLIIEAEKEEWLS